MQHFQVYQVLQINTLTVYTCTIKPWDSTHKFGKWYFGTWSPAKPAFIIPDPWKK